DFADGTRLTIADLQLLVLQGTPGNDSLLGYTTNDTLDGGAGNDAMSGRRGDDTYVFGRGYGQDTIDEEGADSGAADRVQFKPGVAVSDVAFTRSGNNLVIKINGTTDQLTIIDGLWSAFNNPGIARDRVEFFDFADGTRLSIGDVQLLLLQGTSGN